MVHLALGRRVFLPGEPTAYLIRLAEPLLIFCGSLIDVPGEYTEVRVDNAGPGKYGEGGKHKAVKPAGQYECHYCGN